MTLYKPVTSAQRPEVTPGFVYIRWRGARLGGVWKGSGVTPLTADRVVRVSVRPALGVHPRPASRTVVFPVPHPASASLTVPYSRACVLVVPQGRRSFHAPTHTRHRPPTLSLSHRSGCHNPACQADCCSHYVIVKPCRYVPRECIIRQVTYLRCVT